MTIDKNHTFEALKSEATLLGASVLGKTIFNQKLQLTEPNSGFSIAVGSAERFAKDNGYVAANPEKQGDMTVYMLAKASDLKNKQPPYDAAGAIAMDDNGNIIGFKAGSVNTATLIKQAEGTALLNRIVSNLPEIQNDKYVEHIRSKENLSVTDKGKLINLRGIENHIETNIDKSRGNIIHYGEVHTSPAMLYAESLVKNIAVKKFGVKEFYSENTASLSGNVMSVNGISFGRIEMAEYYNPKRKNEEKVHALDIPTNDFSSKESMDKRDANFIKVFNENYRPNTNVFMVTGNAHVIIDEKLKAKANVVALGIHSSSMVIEDVENHMHLKPRWDYADKNTYNIVKGITEEIDKSLPNIEAFKINGGYKDEGFIKLRTEADRVYNIYENIRAEVDNVAKNKAPQRTKE